MGRYSGKTCRLSIMLSLTFSFFLVEIVFGYITNSMALVADSFHMLSDVVALIIAFFCMKISKKRSSSKNTFGWVRAEVLGALINAVFLIALCFSIFIEALKRLIEPEEIHDPKNILIVGILGLVVNIVGIFMFHGHASVHGHSHARPVPLNLPLNGANGVSLNVKSDQQTSAKSPAKKRNENGRVTDKATHGDETNIMIENENTENRQHDEEEDELDEDQAIAEQLSPVVSEAHNISVFNTGDATDTTDGDLKKHAHGSAQLNMHGVFLHILGDAFGSVIVIINAVIYWQVDNETVKKYLDPSLSLAMALIIFSTTLPLFKESAFILLQTVPTHIDVEEIKRKLLKSIDGILAVHEFHVWRLAGNKIIATAHIRCRNLNEYMKIAESVKQLFHDEGIHSTTIQPEFDEVVAPNVEACVLECPKESKCAPSMCCSAPKLQGGLSSVVTTSPPDDQSPSSTESSGLRRKIPSSEPVLTSLDKPSSPPSASAAVAESSESPSGASEEEHFQGVPPILYYNKGYNQLNPKSDPET